jgi:hypothetical protein
MRDDENRARSAIHCGLIGRVVADVIVVDYVLVLRFCEFVWLVQVDASEVSIDRSVDRPIDQATSDSFACELPHVRMHIFRYSPPFGIPVNIEVAHGLRPKSQSR